MTRVTPWCANEGRCGVASICAYAVREKTLPHEVRHRDQNNRLAVQDLLSPVTQFFVSAAVDQVDMHEAPP
jgi:hypothetical protein